MSEQDSREVREEVETLKIIDTSGMLTTDDLKELKQLASMSRTTKIVVGAVFAVVGLFKLPEVLDWLGVISSNIKH